MQNALTDAVAAANDPDATQDQIDALAAALKDAIEALEKAEPGKNREKSRVISRDRNRAADRVKNRTEIPETDQIKIPAETPDRADKEQNTELLYDRR